MAMRIIAGKRKGKRLKTVSGLNVRPTSDRIKESVFQVIGPFFDGGRVLDLFAGSGALGLEALSRGAERAVFVDRSRDSIRVIHDNLRSTGFAGQAQVYRWDARSALRMLAKQGTFQTIFLDPPYRDAILSEVLKGIASGGLLEPSGTVVVERAAETKLEPAGKNLMPVRTLHFGEIAVDLYRMVDFGDTGGAKQ